MMSLKAFCIPMGKGTVSFSGIRARYPEVGLGVVGMNMLRIFWDELWLEFSRDVSAVTKPMLYIPCRGYSSITTLLKIYFFPVNNTSLISLMVR